jgi:hypothetical protein
VTLEVALSEVQAHMGAAVVRTAPIEDDGALAEATRRIVAPGVRLSPVQQLEIYREQFWLRHIGAMKEDFVTLHHLLGEDAFRSLCERYLAAHPPESFTLRDLGDRFAEFVRATEPWSKDTLLHDCARLEWAFIDAFDAADAPPLDPVSIAEAPEEAWGGARVVLHPSMRLVAMEHPAHVYRAQVRDEKKPERPAPAATRVVVYRGPEKLMYIAVEPLAFDLLARLAKGVPLAAACEEVAAGAAVADDAELETKVGGWFQAWAAYGWVSRVEF